MLLALPIVLMKLFNVLPIDESNGVFFEVKIALQIAGISYLIFKVMGLYVDQRGEGLVPLVDFINFTLFVPALLIGPIDRYQRFTKELENGYKGIYKT